jgi:sugar phosphate isomerase/epimerase
MPATLVTDVPGVSCGAYLQLSLGAALARIAECAAAAEVRSMPPHSLLEPANQRAVAASGLRLSVHGPFGGRDEDLAAVDERSRRAALAVHRRHLEVAAELGAWPYIVHPDWCDSPRRRDPLVEAALLRSFDQLREWQEETGVPIVVENMPGAGRSHLAAPGDLDLRGLGFLLDVGHASISGTLEAYLAAPPPELRHVHLHDNRGPADAEDPHLRLGAGSIDFAPVLTMARAAGASVVLEIDDHDGVLASLAYLRGLGLI